MTRQPEQNVANLPWILQKGDGAASLQTHALSVFRSRLPQTANDW